jgi:hypothetical protein
MVHSVYSYMKTALGEVFYIPQESDDYQDGVVQRIFSGADQRLRNFINSHFIKNSGSKARVLVSSWLCEMGLDFEGLCTVVYLGLPSTLMHFRQGLGRAARRKGEKGHGIVYVNGTDYDGTDKCLVNLCENDKECRQLQLYRPLGEVFQSTGTCCDVCCVATGNAKPIFDFPSCELPPAPAVQKLPEQPAVLALRSALLSSVINKKIDPTSLSPFLTGPARAARLSAGGASASLCKEYADAFAEGQEMSTFLYDDIAHKDIVLRCIATSSSLAG